VYRVSRRPSDVGSLCRIRKWGISVRVVLFSGAASPMRFSLCHAAAAAAPLRSHRHSGVFPVPTLSMVLFLTVYLVLSPAVWVGCVSRRRCIYVACLYWGLIESYGTCTAVPPQAHNCATPLCLSLHLPRRDTTRALGVHRAANEDALRQAAALRILPQSRHRQEGMSTFSILTLLA
jgi:hypothetical protein